MNIDIIKLLKLQEKEKINIIDIRNSLLYNNGHIESSKNIPQTNLMLSPEKYINKHDIYYIYCQQGTSSSYLCTLLNNLGYRTVNIIGGYNAYKSIKYK